MKTVSSVLYLFSILFMSLAIIATGLLLGDTVKQLDALERRVDLLEAGKLPSGNTGRIGAIE